MLAFENFWNMWASRQKYLVVVICGSAASWMIQKVINNRGGLHNAGSISVMAVLYGDGGIPLYLKEVNIGESTAQDYITHLISNAYKVENKHPGNSSK
ncbi:hypothetical protein [Chitinophaga sp.]|uniref:hypothetical protein n=1 Tax=Chitinophaga sp. TaxID=1869181 RepID=UPI0031D8C317